MSTLDGQVSKRITQEQQALINPMLETKCSSPDLIDGHVINVFGRELFIQSETMSENTNLKDAKTFGRQLMARSINAVAVSGAVPLAASTTVVAARGVAGDYLAQMTREMGRVAGWAGVPLTVDDVRYADVTNTVAFTSTVAFSPSDYGPDCNKITSGDVLILSANNFNATRQGCETDFRQLIVTDIIQELLIQGELHLAAVSGSCGLGGMVATVAARAAVNIAIFEDRLSFKEGNGNWYADVEAELLYQDLGNRLLLVVPPEYVSCMLEVMRQYQPTEAARAIGYVKSDSMGGRAWLNTSNRRHEELVVDYHSAAPPLLSKKVTHRANPVGDRH